MAKETKVNEAQKEIKTDLIYAVVERRNNAIKEEEKRIRKEKEKANRKREIKRARRYVFKCKLKRIFALASLFVILGLALTVKFSGTIISNANENINATQYESTMEGTEK